MPEADRMLGMYLHLARASHGRRQLLVRDKILILAGVQAEEMGLAQISALCRQKILAHNNQHLVRQWPTFAAALADDHFQSYLKQLRRRYSAEKIEHIVDSLGIEMGRERDAYFDDLEYAAALLDTKPESIPQILAPGIDDAAGGPHEYSGRAAEPGSGNRPVPRALSRVQRMGLVVVSAALLALTWFVLRSIR